MSEMMDSDTEDRKEKGIVCDDCGHTLTGLYYFENRRKKRLPRRIYCPSCDEIIKMYRTATHFVKVRTEPDESREK